MSEQCSAGLRLRRASDDAERDFWPDRDGKFDWVEVQKWAGGDVYVKVVYAGDGHRRGNDGP
jgi:hypothetical protein